MNVCKICGNKINNKIFIAREMMFGLRDEFDYFECTNCGCLQIKKFPENISKYYPEKYNSFDRVNKTKDNFIKSFLKLQKTKYYLLGEKNIIGMFLLKKYGCGFLGKIKRANINLDTKILDIGSGTGGRLVSLRRDGIRNIVGIDPFIERNIYYDAGLTILKRDMFEIEDRFDFIMLNHSFEHMPEPLPVLNKLYQLLNPNKYLLIRIPVAASYSWRKYGVNWIALDAPRHFFLHTSKSIKILTEKVGFQLVDIMFDSTDYQFWGSEQYLKDIPLRDSRSYYENPNSSIFSKNQIQEFKAKAIELNKNNDGDCACFYLYKPANNNV